MCGVVMDEGTTRNHLNLKDYMGFWVRQQTKKNFCLLMLFTSTRHKDRTRRFTTFLDTSLCLQVSVSSEACLSAVRGFPSVSSRVTARALPGPGACIGL